MRDDDLTAWRGPIAKLPTDRFAAALLMALALREQFSAPLVICERPSVNVQTLCKRLKTEKLDEPAS